MAENVNEPGYNFLWQRAKFGNILFSGSNISQLNNDEGYLTASGSISSSISSSYATSASYAVTASYALTAQTLLGSVTSASYASTASYVLPLQQNVIITGSLLLTSSYISTVDYIDFNNTGIPPPTDIEGRIYWDEDNGTLSLGMHGGQVVQQVGLENYFYIKNQSGVTIPNGSVVRAAGTLGASGRILGDLMIANGSIVYYFTLGIATEDIINGEDGYITEFGNVRNVNTTGASVGETWIDGDVLWVSPTVLGGLTKFEPDSPNLKIQMAIVINAAANGTLFVRPDLSGFLTDLHNVNDFTTTGSFGDLLVKSGSTWINSKQLTGSYGLTGSLTATSFTGSLFGTASFANTAISSSYAVTASFALNGGGGTTDTGSLLTTASIAGDTITFTKGNGSTFPIIIPASSDPAGWTTIVKSANQDVTNSSTHIDDTELQFSVVAGGHYMLEMNLIISANNTVGDYTSRFGISSGTFKGKGYMIGPTATGAAQVNSYESNGVTTTNPLVLGTPLNDIDYLSSVKIIYSFTPSANAIFSFKFANAAAGVGRISRTWKGSILKYKQID
jgi:hypothetical protein